MIGFRTADRAGSPVVALGVAVALLWPLAGLVFGAEASRHAAPESRPQAEKVQLLIAPLARAAAAREATGLAGLALALPLGIAACLWAGIASARRSRRAGERARLSALAEGHAEAGKLVAAALQRSRAPALGAAIGALGGALVCGGPALGLYLSGRTLIEAIEDAGKLGGGPGATVLLGLSLHAAARPLTAGALAGALGSGLVGGLIGAGLHVRSSRRRNLAVAMAALQGSGASKAAVAAITSALSATGKPRPLGPALIAVVLVLLSALVLAWAASYERLPEAAVEELAATSGRCPTWDAGSSA